MNLIEEFYESDDFGPNHNLEEFKKICNAPFSLVKRVMSSGELRDIRLQYFGVFSVSRPRVKYTKKNLIKKFENGNIPQKRFEDKIKQFEEYEKRFE